MQTKWILPESLISVYRGAGEENILIYSSIFELVKGQINKYHIQKFQQSKAARGIALVYNFKATHHFFVSKLKNCPFRF